ncbi:MAG: DEAD/DEAH box helicase [Planctomycetes bacterium]|nr:DEAD/DEAH box helicase [Planctomycetota bacterium]
MKTTSLAVRVEDRGSECLLSGDVPVQPLFDAFSVPAVSYGVPSLFDLARRSLPAGLLEEAAAIMRERGIRVEVRNARAEPAAAFGWKIEGMEPYRFQDEAVEIAMSRPLSFVQLPCGSGKTLVALSVIARMGVPALVLLHRANLARQFAQEAREILGVEPGIWAAGERSLGPVTVACVQSVRGREGEIAAYEGAPGIRGFPLVIVDEAHHAASPGYFATLSALPCSRRLGLSGTAARGNLQEDRIVRALFGKPVEVRDAAALAAEGLCARIVAEIVEYGGEPLPLCAPWKDLYDGLQGHPERNAAIARKTVELLAEGVPVLVLVGTLEHGRVLSELLAAGGVEAPFLSADDPVEARGRALDRFRAGVDRVLIASPWVNEGTDLPDLGAVVICGGFHARPATIQRVGRVLRKGSPAKGGIGRIVDFDDRHLHPLLAQHLARRIRTYRDALKADVRGAAATAAAAARSAAPKSQIPNPKSQRNHKSQITKTGPRTASAVKDGARRSCQSG